MVWKKIDVPVSPLQEGPAGIVTQRIEEEMEDHTSFPMIFFSEEPNDEIQSVRSTNWFQIKSYSFIYVL